MTQSINLQEMKDKVKKKQEKQNKEANAMKNKNLKETIKTIVITVLATAILAIPLGFYAGAKYERQNAGEVQRQVEAITSLTSKE